MNKTNAEFEAFNEYTKRIWGSEYEGAEFINDDDDWGQI